MDDNVLAPVLSAEALLRSVDRLESDALDESEKEPDVEAERNADWESCAELEGSGLAEAETLGLRVSVSEAVMLAVTHADADLALENVADFELRSDADSSAEREAIDVVVEAVRLGAMMVLEADVHRLRVAEAVSDDDTVGLAEREASRDRLMMIDGEDEDEGQELRDEDNVDSADVVGEIEDRADDEGFGDGDTDIDACAEGDADGHSEADAAGDADAVALEHWDSESEGPAENDAALIEAVAFDERETLPVDAALPHAVTELDGVPLLLPHDVALPLGVFEEEAVKVSFADCEAVAHTDRELFPDALPEPEAHRDGVADRDDDGVVVIEIDILGVAVAQRVGPADADSL